MRSPLALVALLLTVSTPSISQTIVPELDQGGRPGEVARMVYAKAVRQFDEADQNKDGRLTPEEVAIVAPFKAQSFGQFDKNGDGLLDWQEFVGHDRWERQ